MAVYFVYRCHYGAPSEKHVRRFEYDSVLDWAKAVWKLHDTREGAERYARRVFGAMDVAPFAEMFHNRGENSTSRPRTMSHVKLWFTDMYCEQEAHGAHHVQCLTDWGDNQRAVLVFDDHYRAKKP